MSSFEDFNLNKQLRNGLVDLGFETPTPIQVKSYSPILSGKDVVGIAQTGTGKTYAYLLPIIQGLKFSNQIPPRVLIVVPTRELVLQVIKSIEKITEYINIRALGVYGGTNINTQKKAVSEGCDILVSTPGRLYDLIISNSLSPKSIKKLVIDEVDVMLDLGFRFQLNNILELLPEKCQNIMFSATMTQEVEELIDDTFVQPEKISVSISGTPLDNIEQVAYQVENNNTKINLLKHLLVDEEHFSKVLVFVANKKQADYVYESLQDKFGSRVGVIHANKSQNYRIRTVEEFDLGEKSVLIASDVIARGVDFDKISHVINFDTPEYSENYIHRIGRTGRAKEKGCSILLYSLKELEAKDAIESLMNHKITELPFPAEVKINPQLTPEERPINREKKDYNRNFKIDTSEEKGFHEKKEKNKKVNLGGSYRREIKAKYKKPKTRGDKKQNLKKKRK